MQSYGWLLDPSRCIECRACEVACKQWNQVEVGVNLRYRKVRIHESGSFPQVRVQALALSCNHCENAWCMKVCPARAIRRRAEDGIIVVDTDKCLGCGMCGKFCPYDAPQFHARTRRMQKCTMCVDRVEAGLQPACATMCPTGAIQWGKWEDIEPRGVARVENFANPAGTRPRVRFAAAGLGAR